MRALPAYLDAHGAAVHVIAIAVVLASFAFVATAWVIDRLRRPAEARVEKRNQRRRSF